AKNWPPRKAPADDLGVLRTEIEDENFGMFWRGLGLHVKSRMVLRDAVLSRGITRRSIKRADCSLARHAALELASHFFSAALFQRIGTPTRDKRERADDRQGFH